MKFRFHSEISANNALNTFLAGSKVCGLDHVLNKMQTALNEVYDTLERHRNKIGYEIGDCYESEDLMRRRVKWENMVRCAKECMKPWNTDNAPHRLNTAMHHNFAYALENL